ncbi:polysaccharide deacetylase family protein [Paenibacillus sp. Marseille-Q4541]|uniref:polysaccharide deacetylase family protein n=1 Tax=Paenibacillus sp. Marseille-Q4541 TaxID=2831522 RepID=UPI001BAB2B68|nr:polysaccharide deacetylase family protein [Paenibacillus sp. Marseille-Q4541]
MKRKQFLKKWSPRLIVVLVFFVIFYAALVTHPTNVFSQKACTSWQLVKNKAFILSHNQLPEIALDTVQAETITEQAKQVPVLMYHYLVPKSLNKEPGNKSVMNTEDFEEGMDYLHREGYYTPTLQELEQYVKGEISLPKKSVVITFDDGYENNLVYAYPILKKYNFKAAVFVIGSKVNESNEPFDPSRKSFLTKAQMEESKDVFEFHSHTYNLHYKGFAKCGSEYAAGLDTKLLKQDMKQMKELGIDTPYFAYPYGNKSTQMMYYLHEEGYRMAFSVRQGFVKPGDNLMKLNRLTVTTGTDLSVLLHPLDGSLE